MRLSLRIAVALASATTSTIAFDARAVERGAPDATARHAVALCEGDEPTSCALKCSGVLIADAAVLTARHCVIAEAGAAIDCARPVDGGVRTEAARTWVTTSTRVSGGDFARGRSWMLPATRAACGHDLAVLLLEAPLADREARVVAPRFDLPRDARVSLAAYGASSATGHDEGLRRSLEGVPVTCIGGLDTCRAFGGPLSPTEFLADATVCRGDSGAGALIADADGEPSVSGILSRVLGRSDSCGHAVFSRLDEHALLIARAAREASASTGRAVPAWVEQAERRGNAIERVPRSFGSPCDHDDDCDSHACRSANDGQRWVCSAPCASGCPTGATCNAATQSCFAASPPPATSCGAAPRAGIDEDAPLLTFLLVAAAAGFARRVKR